ncbi:MAG: hypothetical protein LAO21_20240 [Acidobacteriia bacterium]|nr:hypothetical protein [Terriglobia bacterium]
MIYRIIIETFLAIASFWMGSLFWQLMKRSKFLKSIVCDQPFLEALISQNNLESPPQRLIPYALKNDVGYFVNMMAIIESDRISQQRTKRITGLLLLVIFIASYFLGDLYLFINITIFLLLFWVPVAQSTKFNAIEHVLALALILHRWRRENEAQCNQWVEEVRSLHPLYNAVKIVESKAST